MVSNPSIPGSFPAFQRTHTPATLASTRNIPKGIARTAPSLVGEAVADTEPVDVFEGLVPAKDFVPLVIVALAAEGVK